MMENYLDHGGLRAVFDFARFESLSPPPAHGCQLVFKETIIVTQFNNHTNQKICDDLHHLAYSIEMIYDH